MPENVITKSDDELTVLRHTTDKLDKFIEQYQEQLQITTSFKEALDDTKARLKFIEDKVNNPDKRWWSGDDDMSRESRERALGQWITNNWRQATDRGWRDSEAGVEWRAGQVSDVNSDGGFLIPTPLLGQVVRVLEKFGVARQICQVVPVSAKSTNVATLATRPTVTWPADNVVPTTTKATFGQLTLEAKLMMALDQISLVVDEDNVTGLASFLIDVFGRAAAKEEDTQAFGTGTSPFTGLTAESGISTHTLSTNRFVGQLTYDDFVNTMHKPDANVIDDAGWLMSKDLVAEALKVKDTNGRPLWNQGLGGPTPNSILGRTVWVSNVMAKAADDAAATVVLAYGDFKFLFIPDRRSIAIDFSGDAGFTSASRYMRLLQRVGFKVVEKTAFGLMKTAA